MARQPRTPRAPAARRRALAPAFEALSVEGSLIAPAQLARVAAQEAGGQNEADYSVLKGLTLRDEMARYFRIGQALFADLIAAPAGSHAAAIRFTQALLRDVLGFADVARATVRERDGRVHPITVEALDGRVPVVVVPPADALDRPSAALGGEGRRISAMLALQDGLNADDGALWGLACNGERLRLVRDNASLTRPAYIEADLRRIFEGEAFADFTALWLLIHASRFGPKAGVDGKIPPPSDCALERWRDAGQKAGLAARDRLRDGVEQALQALGTGFLAHRDNAELRRRLAEGELPLPEFHGRLLRLVYRMIFLAVAEDRGLLHPPDATPAARALYAEGYSFSRLRHRAIKRTARDAHDDLWDGLLIVFEALGTRDEPALGLPALDGLFARGALGELETAALPNKALMEAVYRLAWLRNKGALAPVNWRDMETEELGSVYESLLELTPRLTEDGRAYAFAEGAETKGNQRKTTGSYYTPDSLVQVLLDSALDPVLDRVEREAEATANALLGVTVIDPACGSGHFLLAAARRIATRVARARAGGTASAEDYRHALRDVARACIHGVDRNPMAVELTKVALWIETVEPGKPLGFLDANIRCGDALLGVFDLAALDRGVPDAAYRPLSGDDPQAAKVAGKVNRQQKEQAAQGDLVAYLSARSLAREAAAVLAMPEDDVAALERKADAYGQLRAQGGWGAPKLACDLYVSAFLRRKAFRTDGLAQARTPDRVPTTLDVRTALAGRQPDPRLAALATELAAEARAFHWPLEFPAVMTAKGGFDVVLGNPPWERIKLQEQEFFAPLAPEIAEAPNAASRGRMIAALAAAEPGSRERTLYNSFEQAKRTAEASSIFARVPGEEGGRFPLTGSGDLNTYALFAELARKLRCGGGHFGLVLPSGVITDAQLAPFLRALVASSDLRSAYTFGNARDYFPATTTEMFTLLSAGPGTHPPRVASFIERPEHTTDSDRALPITTLLVDVVNANTKTLPLFRTRADALLIGKLYRASSTFVRDCDQTTYSAWKASFTGFFHMANESRLFVASCDLPGRLEHREWGNLEAATPDGQLWLPLYEGKMMGQYDHRHGSFAGLRSRPGRGGAIPNPTDNLKQDPEFEVHPWYWVASEEVKDRIHSAHWSRKWLFVWRFGTKPSNERTLISTVLPIVASPHVLSAILFDTVSDPAQAALLIANMNSLVVDLACRSKMSRQGLDAFILKQLPVLPPSAYTAADLSFIVSRVLELTYTSWSLQPFARDLGYEGPPFVWDEDRRAKLRAELDAWYARAYGLTRDELRYVLDPADVMGDDYPSETFRVLKSNELRRYGEYRTRRLVLEAWNAQEATRSAPIETDWATLPDRAWARPAAADVAAVRTQTQAQLAAISKALLGPTPAAAARLAATYALEPRLLTGRLQGAERVQWLRLVGPEAQLPGASVAAFGLGGATGWSAALSQLQAGSALIFDPAADTWAPGPGVDGYFTEGWPERASFALTAARRLLTEDSAILSSEEAAGVRALAA